MLDAAAFAHCHEIDDGRCAGCRDRGDLGERGVHRHRMFGDLFGIAEQIRARGEIGRLAAPEAPGAGHRLGGDHAAVVDGNDQFRAEPGRREPTQPQQEGASGGVVWRPSR